MQLNSRTEKGIARKQKSAENDGEKVQMEKEHGEKKRLEEMDSQVQLVQFFTLMFLVHAIFNIIFKHRKIPSLYHTDFTVVV